MKPIKAKYIGIFYAFLMAVIAILFVVYLLNLMSDGELLTHQAELEKLLSSLDIAIPVTLLVTYLLADKLGAYFILSIGEEQKASWTLVNILSMSVPLTYVLVDLIYITDYSNFDSDVFLRYFGIAIVLWISSYFIFVVPGLVLGFFLKRILLRYKP